MTRGCPVATSFFGGLVLSAGLIARFAASCAAWASSFAWIALAASSAAGAFEVVERLRLERVTDLVDQQLEARRRGESAVSPTKLLSSAPNALSANRISRTCVAVALPVATESECVVWPWTGSPCSISASVRIGVKPSRRGRLVADRRARAPSTLFSSSIDQLLPFSPLTPASLYFLISSALASATLVNACGTAGADLPTSRASTFPAASRTVP